MRILGLCLENPVPDPTTTVWQFRDQLIQARVVDELFGAFEGYLKAEDWLARSGQMSDVTIAPVPKQRHNPDENAPIKAGETLQGRDEKPAKNRQEDTNARWTKNNGKSL